MRGLDKSCMSAGDSQLFRARKLDALHAYESRPCLLIPERPLILPYLPNEIWLMIIEYLPPTFFQKDLGRLTLSKRWYSLCYSVFHNKIQCTPGIISRIVKLHRQPLPPHRRSPNIGLANAVSRWRRSAQSIDIAIEGPQAFNSIYNTAENLPRFCNVLLEWEELKTVRFTVGWEKPAFKTWPSDKYLPLRAVKPFLSILTNITHLDLDLCGATIKDGRDGQAYTTKPHFCLHLRQLVSRLTSLRLRLRCICQFALRPILKKKVTLRELSVSLYLGDVSKANPKVNMSRLCSGAGNENLGVPGVAPPTYVLPDWKWVNPIDHMRAEMKRLLPKMVRPTRVELEHLAPSGEVHVWDALEGRCVRETSQPRRRFESPGLWGEMLGESKGCFQQDGWRMDNDFEIDDLVDTDNDDGDD